MINNQTYGFKVLAAALLTAAMAGNAFADFTIEAGETFTLTAGETFTIDGNLTIDATGTLDASAGGTNIIVSGNWTNNGTFTAGDGTVTFIDSGTVSTITGDTTFYNFTCVTANKQISFTVGSTQTVDGAFNMNGQATGTEILLRSTAAGSKWFIQVPPSQTVDYLDVKDSDALVNQIRAEDSINSGNNNANWFFVGVVVITYPVDGSTVGTQPTVRGTADAGSTVEVYGLVGTVSTKIGETTSDSAGNWRLEQSDYIATLDLLANTLTAEVGALSSNVVNITVAAAPTPVQVPQITSPIDGGTVSGITPVIEGDAQSSQTVTLEARDADGNLLLSDVAATTSAGDGSFTINTADYTTDLVKGYVYVSVIVNGVASNVIELKFADPFGVVFDSVTNDLIADANVTLYYNDPNLGWIVAGPGVHFDNTALGAGGVAATNPQTTAADGYYAFMAIDGDFYLDIAPPAGYVYPSAATTFPAGRTVTTGSKGEVFTIAGVILEIDQPVDTSDATIRLTKEANRSKAVVGDIVTYTVTMQNTASDSVSGITLDDIIPAGFKYINGRAILDDTSITDPTGTRPLSFNIGTITAGATRTLKYQLVVGSGVGFGEYTNVAQAKNSGGLPISNTAREKVSIVPDPLFDLGTVIGKVFHDENENGRQDKGEPTVGGAKIVMEDGTVITTDKNGMYHLEGIMPGRHLFKIVMSTVPEGATLTTEEAVVIDVTKGLMRKVNFGLRLPEGGVKTRPFTISTDTSRPTPRLNVALVNDELIIKGERLEREAQFRIFTNYQLFINKWKLEILDKDTDRVIKTFKGTRKNIFEPLNWDGNLNDSASKAPKLREGRSYVYKLTVTGKDGKEDVTKDREFSVRREKPKTSMFEDGSEKTERQLEDEYRQWLSREVTKNNLETQTITIEGQTVNISDIKAGAVRITKGKLITSEVPVVGTKAYSAKDLLEGKSQEEVQSLSDIELILPNGEYDLQVTGPDGKFSDSTTITGISGTTSGDSSVTEAESYNQHLKIGDDYLFLVALGDAKMGYNFNSDNVELVNKDDKFEDGFWSEGRLAFHLKGKVKGKYLVTASFDSDRNKKELFRNLDPDRYYPVYGDGSSVNYQATNTQGILYALVEWDKSSVLWGNYNTSFTDTEFAQFSRTLYGGKVHLQSVSTTKFGQPTSKVVVFRAQAHQKASHNELLGTGGSLYYLKHKDIIEGSDKVKVETRDKVTGLVLSTRDMQEGIDYEMDYTNGRIIFWQPVSHVTASDSIISSALLDGNPVYVVVDYEYETKDRFNEATVGARAQQAIGDNVVVGGTYVKEKQTKDTYELKAADTTVHLGKDIKITAEYAESESESTGSFISTDGGLSFTELPTAETSKGRAYGVKGQASLLDNKLGVESYYKKIDNDFSTSATSSQQGKEMYGAGGKYDLSDKTRVSVSHDVQKLVDDGNLQTQLQVGATKTATSSVQIVHDSNDLRVTAEYRHQEVTERKSQYESETNREEDIIAARADYKLDEKTIVSVEHQRSTDDGSNNQTSVGIETKINDSLALRAEETLSPDGTATSVGVTSKVADKFDISADLTRAMYKNGATANTASVSANARVNEKTELHSTFAQTDSMDGGKTSSMIFGGKRKINDELEFTTDRTFASSRDKDTVGTSLGFLRNRDGRILEGTFSREYSESLTETSNSNIFGLSGDINDKWAFSANFERGKVQNHDGTRATRNVGGFGLGFVNKDQETGEIILKASSKFELRYDNGNEDKRQYLIYTGIEGKLNPNTTFFAKANLSQTKNTTTGRTDALYRELVFGTAYRPIDYDWLNLIGRYTYLEDDSPASQSSITGIDEEKAHVLAGEAVIDLNERWQLSEKFAYKTGKQKISGFDFTKTSTWLWANRLSYKFDKGWMLSGEYRLLNQKQADDRMHGALLELTKNLNKNFLIGIGYNFAKFDDDLAHQDYRSQGPFIRITGKF
jgi:uncharacterized repeat protein (TIGR01451 family)